MKNITSVPTRLRSVIACSIAIALHSFVFAAGSPLISEPVEVQGTVEVLNDALRIPFNRSIYPNFTAGQESASGVFPTIPVGKRLVIETIAYSVSVPSGQVVIATFLAPGGTSNGSGFSVPVALTPQGTFSPLSSFGALSYFAGTHKVKIIVDPRLNTLGIAASSYRSGTTGTGTLHATIIGYLEDLPALAP